MFLSFQVRLEVSIGRSHGTVNLGIKSRQVPLVIPHSTSLTWRYWEVFGKANFHLYLAKSYASFEEKFSAWKNEHSFYAAKETTHFMKPMDMQHDPLILSNVRVVVQNGLRVKRYYFQYLSCTLKMKGLTAAFVSICIRFRYSVNPPTLVLIHHWKSSWENRSGRTLEMIP